MRLKDQLSKQELVGTSGGPGNPGRSLRLNCPVLLVRGAAKLATCNGEGLAKDVKSVGFPAASCSPAIESIQLPEGWSKTLSREGFT